MEDTQKVIVIHKIAYIDYKLQKHVCKITKQINTKYNIHIFNKVILVYGCIYFFMSICYKW